MKEERNIVYATFWQRLLAHNIDLIFLLILFYLSTLIPIAGYDYLIMPFIYVFYCSLFELSVWEATPGKKWTKLKVTYINEKNNHILLTIVRNACKLLSLLLLFGGFAMISFNRKKQGLHDVIAGTVVLFEEEIV